MNIIVSSGTIESYSGPETTLKLRIYNKYIFATAENETVLHGKVGSTNYYKELDCTVGVACAPGETDCISYPTFTLDSTEDGTPNNSSYTFALYTNAGVPLGIVYCDLKIPAAPTPTTLAAIAIYNAAPAPVLPATYYTANQVDILLAALTGAAVKATDVIFGVVAISDPAAVASQPIAVGQNSPVWIGITETVYLEQYNNDLGAALVAIGASLKELLFTCPYIETIDRTIPPNVFVRMEGDASITVNATKKLTISSMSAHGPERRLFYGLGQVVVLRPSEMWIEWWTGPGLKLNYTTAVTTAMLSLTAQGEQAGQGGGTMKWGSGDWRVRKIIQPNYSTFLFTGGNDPDAGSYSPNTRNGTVIRYAVNADTIDPDSAAPPVVTGTKFIFSVPDRYRMQRMENGALSTYGTPDAHCILIERDNPIEAGFHHHITRMALQTDINPTVHAYKAWDSRGIGATEMVGNVIEKCWFQVGASATPGAVAAVYIDSTNFALHFEGINTFQIGVNSTGIKAYRRGWITGTNFDLRGVTPVLVYTTTLQRTIASASLIPWPTNTYFGLITLNPATPQANQFTPEDMGQRFTFPANGPRPAFAEYIFQIIDNFNAVYSFYPGTSITNETVQAHRWNDFAGAAHAAWDLQGDSRGMVITGGIDEGFNYSIIASSNIDFATVFIGYTGQGKVKFTGAGNEMFKSIGCHWFAGAFHDETAGPQVQASFDETTKFNNHTAYGNIYVREAFVWGKQAWQGSGLPATQTLIDRSIKQYWVDPPLGTSFSFKNYGVEGQNSGTLYSGWNDENTPNAPVRWSAQRVRKQLVGDTQIIQKRIGLQDFFGKWQYYYDDVYNDYDGRRYFKGNQDAVKGYVFDGLVKGKYFLPETGGEITTIAPIVYNNTSTLANTLLKADVEIGYYDIEVEFDVDSLTRGIKVDFDGGTAVFSYFNGQWHSYTCNAPASDPVIARITGIATDFDGVDINGHYRFHGGCLVSTAGTLIVRAAQTVAHASNTTILLGAGIRVTRRYPYGTI